VLQLLHNEDSLLIFFRVWVWYLRGKSWIVKLVVPLM
jgi:hypothetical protein